jgi:hypothetical protein
MKIRRLDPNDYRDGMSVWSTDQHRGRLHRCSICAASYWSAWGQARKHWARHSFKERKQAIAERQWTKSGETHHATNRA